MPKIRKNNKPTKADITAIAEAGNLLSAMVGCGSDFDDHAKKVVKGIDRFLKKHGYKRKYN